METKKQTIYPGRIYRHFKGDLYLVEAIARNADSAKEMVIYRQLYGDGSLWVRELDEFASPVDHEKYPEMKQTWRFELQKVEATARHS